MWRLSGLALILRANRRTWSQGIKKVFLDISYIGLTDLTRQSGSIVWAKKQNSFCEGDSFTMGEPGSMPEHAFNPFSKDRGDVVGAYVIAKTPAGNTSASNEYRRHPCYPDESSAWRAYKSKGVSCCRGYRPRRNVQNRHQASVKALAEKRAAEYGNSAFERRT